LILPNSFSILWRAGVEPLVVEVLDLAIGLGRDAGGDRLEKIKLLIASHNASAA